MPLDIVVGKVDEDDPIPSEQPRVGQLGTTGRCVILSPFAGKRTGGAVWPTSTEDTDQRGAFKPRSDVDSEPEKEGF
jgi:hypothetical protein